MKSRPVPWNLLAILLGTSLFLAMPYTLYVYAAAVVLGFAAAVVFLILSPFILAYQYVRYKRVSGAFPLEKEREG